MLFDKNFSEIYSVIPRYFFFKKLFLETGPLINLFEIPVLIISKPILKDFSMYLLDLTEILSNALVKL